ncbi:MAG TPA: sialidase family protein, partial [Myxococcales bacterium]|nr:sialidase family protein [Myxococcales bacterium]
WMDYRSGAWDTYYRRSRDRGATWDPEVVIAASTGPFGAERPQVAARGDSVHVTIWDDRANNPPCTPGSYTFPKCPDTFHVRSVNGGTTWGTITNVAGGGAYFSGRNDVAVAGSSDVVINYNVDVQGETGSKLFVVRSADDGLTWGTPVRLTYSANASDHGSIIGAGNGVHLVWHDDRTPGNREIYYRSSTSGGATWDPEEQVSSGAAGDSSTPLDAVTSGFLHVIWIDNRGGTYQVYYRSRALPAAPDGGQPADGGDGGGPGRCGCDGTGAPAILAGLALAGMALLLRRRGAPR